jgi:hypothetical protein
VVLLITFSASISVGFFIIIDEDHVPPSMPQECVESKNPVTWLGRFA